MYPYIQDCKKCDFKAICKIKKQILQFNDNTCIIYLKKFWYEIITSKFCNKCRQNIFGTITHLFYFHALLVCKNELKESDLYSFKYLGYTFQIRILHILKQIPHHHCSSQLYHHLYLHHLLLMKLKLLLSINFHLMATLILCENLYQNVMRM